MKLLLSLAILTLTAVAAQDSQVALHRFEALRVNPDAVRSLPGGLDLLIGDPVPDGEAARTIDEAIKKAGFTPHLLNGKTATRIFVTSAVDEQAKVSVLLLQDALKQAGITDVTVPAAWEGAVIRLRQPSGILVDYGDFYVAQAPPSTVTAPPGFPLAECMELLFRAMGMSAADSRAQRERFAANPAAFLPISPRFEMDIRQVPLKAGPGLLLQNADKGGELAFMWSTADRSYFLTGLLKEDEAIAAAQSLQ